MRADLRHHARNKLCRASRYVHLRFETGKLPVAALKGEQTRVPHCQNQGEQAANHHLSIRVLRLDRLLQAGETELLGRHAALFALVLIGVISPIQLYSQGYGGPSLLSRGGNSPGHRGRGPIDFNFYAAARGMYESGLIEPTLNESGDLVHRNLFGGQIEGGAYGAKSWRKSSVGLDYRGDYRKNSSQGLFDGTNQAISFDAMYQPTRRTSFFFRETGGTSNRAFGAFAAPTFVGQQNFAVPLNEVYDTKVYYTQTSGGMSYRKSARTTLAVFADAFVTKRTNLLIGMQGYSTGADYEYRVTRSDSIGFMYNYIRFSFPRIFGGSFAHGLSVKYDKRFNRNWSGRILAGFFNVETEGTEPVTLSPEVALILGRSQGVQAFHRTSRVPQIEARGAYTLERSSFTVGYATGIGPGNGIYITSRQDTANLGYSYTGIRRTALGASIGATRTKSVGLELGDFSTFQGGGGFSYKIAEYISITGQADRRRFNSPTVPGRSGTSITLGLSYSPSRLPISIW